MQLIMDSSSLLDLEKILDD